MRVSRVSPTISEADRKAAAAFALARGATVSQAAIEAGVSPRTIYRWKRDKEFRCQIQTLHGPALVSLVPKALRALEDALDHGSDKVRLAAAFKVLQTTGVIDAMGQGPEPGEQPPETGFLVLPPKRSIGQEF